MTNTWRRTGLTVIVAAAWLGFATQAGAIDYKDVYGSWCSATAKLTLSKTTMKVALFSSGQTFTYKVTGYKLSADRFSVEWIDAKNEAASSHFGEFSANRRRMFLQPDEKVPRREYNRC